MIAFDAVAAWYLGQRGYDVREWFGNLRRHSEGVDPESGQGTVTWRLRPECPPAGAWFSTLSVKVREDGTGHTTMENLRLSGGIYLAPHKGLSAVLLDQSLPDVLVSALPGRTVGDLIDLSPVAESIITEASLMPDIPGIEARTHITFAQVLEMHEIPFFLLP